MWATSGNQGRSWRYGNVVLSNPLPFKVTFQAEVGGDQWTDIAIDDLSFTQGCAIGGNALFSDCTYQSLRLSATSSNLYHIYHISIFSLDMWGVVRLCLQFCIRAAQLM